MPIKKLFKTSPLREPPPGPSGSGKKQKLAPIPGSLLFADQAGDQMFWKGFKYSAGVHAALTVIVVVATLVVPHQTVKFVPSIAVDIIGLPDVSKKDLQNLSPADLKDLDKKLDKASKSAHDALAEAQKAKPEPKLPDDTMTMKSKDKKLSRKDSLQSAIERIKAIEALENEDVRTNEKVKKGPAKAVPAKGNALSKGNSLTGQVAGDMNAYLGKLQNKLKDNWSLPPWLAKQKLRAKVLIFLNATGGVKSTMFVEDSGNKQFNDNVLRTIEQAEPFGIPPEDLVDTGITLGFPL